MGYAKRYVTFSEGTSIIIIIFNLIYFARHWAIDKENIDEDGWSLIKIKI